MGRLTLQAGPLFHLLPGKPNRSHEALRKNLTGLLTSPKPTNPLRAVRSRPQWAGVIPALTPVGLAP